MSDYTVRLDELFQGPMDLLLHLVREQEVDIQEVSISKVIEGYFDYLKTMKEMDLEIAGEFIVMAASLMIIKSRSLLPGEEISLEDELDPADELVQRLVEYRRFKGAADDLQDRWSERGGQNTRGYRGEVKDNEPEKTLDLEDLTVYDLLTSFSRLMRETLANRPHRVRGESRPLRWYVRGVGAAIRSGEQVGLKDLVVSLSGSIHAEGVIGVFCAILELMKLGILSAR